MCFLYIYKRRKFKRGRGKGRVIPLVVLNMLLNNFYIYRTRWKMKAACKRLDYSQPVHTMTVACCGVFQSGLLLGQILIFGSGFIVKEKEMKRDERERARDRILKKD